MPATVVEMVGQVGIAGMWLDMLAERARLSKGTAYPRWLAKERFVIDALCSATSPVDDVDTETRGALDARFVAQVLAILTGGAFPHQVGDGA